MQGPRVLVGRDQWGLAIQSSCLTFRRVIVIERVWVALCRVVPMVLVIWLKSNPHRPVLLSSVTMSSSDIEGISGADAEEAAVDEVTCLGA